MMVKNQKLKKNKSVRKIRFDIITIFPNIFDSYLKESLIKRAIKNKIIEVKIHNLRDWSNDRRGKVDDRPFGGGPGMVLKFDPISRAVKKVKLKKSKTRVILFSLRGQKLDENQTQKLTQFDQIILICGRYEGIDERVAEYIADEEISIGDFVLSGGELPALVLIEAISRFQPGFLGKYESLETIKGSYPVYTKPAEVKYKTKKLVVPRVLLTGHHRKIHEWRKNT